MKILVLAGGSDQIALLKELSVRGHDTILLDYYENPPAKQYADKHIVASTLDVEKVKQVCIEEKVDLIMYRSSIAYSRKRFRATWITMLSVI